MMSKTSQPARLLILLLIVLVGGYVTYRVYRHVEYLKNKQMASVVGSNAGLVGGSPEVQAAFDDNINFDTQTNGALSGWTNTVGTMTVQPIDDGDTGRKGFGGSQAAATALYTKPAMTSRFEATYSFILHTDGTKVSEPALVWSGNIAHTNYYSLTPVFYNGNWLTIFITSVNGKAIITDGFKLPSQTWANGDEINVHVLFDSKGLHYKVWERNTLQPSAWMREVRNSVIGPRLPAGYLGFDSLANDGGMTGLVQDFHAWNYPSPYYSSETNDTLADGQAIKIVYPPGYNAATGCPLMIFFHGAGGSVRQLETQPQDYGPICAAGYMVAMCNAQGDNWGNKASQADYASLYAYCHAHMKITKLVFGGGSMGGLDELLSLVNGSIPTPAFVYLIYPVCNLRAVYDDPFGFAKDIRKAHGIALSGNDYVAKTSGCDPAQYPSSAFPDIPYFICRLPADSVVLTNHNTDVLRTLLESKQIVKVTDFPGTHGDPSTDAPQLFVDEAARVAHLVDSRPAPTANQPNRASVLQQ